MPEPGLAVQVLERRLDPASSAPIVTAFSGGGDSLALMLAARAFAVKSGRPLVAVHVDHGLQPLSGAFADRAEATAVRLGVSFVRLAWTAPKPVTGVPAAARAARHRLIARACRDLGARVVLIGHTLDDQLENVLMRGAGVPVGALREWSPSPVWPEGRGLFLCRPLLALRRADLRAWLTAQDLGWLDDPANADPRHPRVQARLALAEGAAAVCSAEPDLHTLADLWRVTPWGGLLIDRRGLLDAPPDQALRLLQMAAACASGAEGLARPARARGLMARLRRGERFVASLCGARIEAGPEHLSLEREAGEAERGGLEPVVLDPERPQVWDGRFDVRAPTPGWRVEALRGQTARLNVRDRAALLGVAVSARPALPVFRSVEDQAAPPRLALAGSGPHLGPEGFGCRTLAGERMAAAAGLVTREDQCGTIARMADSLRPPYVEAGCKD
jgi:tRNA(Ile)-lysidine synthase